MKKLIGILAALLILVLCACAAVADEVPQPEGGKKFESDWVVPGGQVEIYYEEEGYKMMIQLPGSEWEYSCYYQEATDSLVSISSSRVNYTIDPDTLDRVYGAPVYEGLDEEGQGAEFTINEKGCLVWNDRRENAGAGLEFVNNGRFEGLWKNEAEEVEVEFGWNGLYDEDRMSYTVSIQRGKEGADQYAVYLMEGTYDPATGKLSAYGTCTTFIKNADGGYDTQDDGEGVDAFFSMTESGKLLYETANGIELEYDILGR